MIKTPLTVVILTYNEEVNIRQALDNVVGWAKVIYILDSYSNDKTIEIVNEYDGVQVFYRKFDNYAAQRNHAIKNLPHQNEWMFFLDADEYLTSELKKEISATLSSTSLKFNGFYIKRRFYFMGKWIKYGGYYPTKLLRLFKHECAVCEREINEHINVQGEIGGLEYDFADSNNKDFSFWIDKHNTYSSFEARQFDSTEKVESNIFGNSTERKQWIRQHIWNVFLPPLVRPFLYFIYRYFFRLGFLDGKVGFIYHFMHGLVYRFMIDVKYIESKARKPAKKL
jgi:glycosyltransferase involved in cell wall biosynthesis